MLKTVDGGQTWVKSYFYNVDWFLSVSFADSITGFATGSSGTIFKTVDGGINWFALKSGTSNSLYSVFITRQKDVYAVGEAGTILKLSNDTLTSTVGISKNTVAVFPNPADQFLNIVGGEDVIKVIIFDMRGEIVFNQKLISNPINISHLKNGIYIIKVIGNSGLITKKIVKL